MTDDERLSLVISVFGYVPGGLAGPRDPRIPADVKNMSAGYTPGVPRLGIPAIQSSDASMGITNPGYRPDDEGATAFPSLIALGSSFNPKVVREDGEAIATSFQRLEPAVAASCDAGDFTAALMALASAKPVVDRYFDEVMVMADDPAVRANRLALLSGVAGTMNRVADLSKL